MKLTPKQIKSLKSVSIPQYLPDPELKEAATAMAIAKHVSYETAIHDLKRVIRSWELTKHQIPKQNHQNRESNRGTKTETT